MIVWAVKGGVVRFGVGRVHGDGQVTVARGSLNHSKSTVTLVWVLGCFEFVEKECSCFCRVGYCGVDKVWDSESGKDERGRRK